MEERGVCALGSRLKALRRARGLTLDALAAGSGVSRAMISRVERGEASPTAALLGRLCATLGVSLSGFFALDGPSGAASPLSRRGDQPVWRDPATGYRRRNVSPPSPEPGAPMPAADLAIRIVDAAAARALLPGLVDILVDAVRGGASIGFMNPFAPEEARVWWDGVLVEVEAGRTVLFVAEDAGILAGTAQLIPATKPNQPHRADVSKVMVHSRFRQRGIGRALMQAVDAQARRRALGVLVLDTATGSPAERLYESTGWRKVGVIPDYALWPDGGFCATTVFYKHP